MPGPLNTSLTPMVRVVMEAAEVNEEVTVLCAAQSAKTQTIMNLVCSIVRRDPGPMFWVMAAADDAKEFAKTRLIPQFQSTPALVELVPKQRTENTNALLIFPTMPLMFRGSNSKSKLQSTPIRWLILDELRNYAKGALELVLKRVRAWWNRRVFKISTAGNVNDAIHTSFKDGTQTHFHFTCPHCKQSQPFRFGDKANPIFPSDRLGKGFIWESSETTKPNGVWDYRALAPTVRYECENQKCLHRFSEEDKGELLETLHPVDYNPRGKHPSFHWSAWYMPWFKWSDGVEEFLKADLAWRRGDLEPLKAWLTETDAIPWEIKGERPQASELVLRCGSKYGDPYERGTKWTGKEETALVLTVDFQGAGGSFLKFVLRQWTQIGNSRLIDYGILQDFDELRDYQVRHKVPSCFIDSGYNAAKVYERCVEYGWTPLKGEDKEHFLVKDAAGHSTRSAWKSTQVDPSLGKEGQGRMLIQLLLWSNPSYKDRLLLHIALGRGPIWQLPDDIKDDYLGEIAGEERVIDEEGVPSWKKVGPNDYLDAELMQLVVADAGGVSVLGEVSA